MKRTVFWVVCLACLQQAVAQDFIGKGKVALSSRDTATALQSFKAAINQGQKPGEANYYLGAIAFAQNRTADALPYLQAAVKANDENVDALVLLSETYARMKDLQNALATIKRAQKIAPKNPQVAVGYGHALLAADSVDAAIVQLTRAQELDPQNPSVPLALGDAYLKQNVVALAVAKYQKAKELAPKSIPVRLRIAQAYEKNRQYGEAVQEYEGIIGVDSTFADAYLNVGKIYVRASSPQQKRLAVAPLKKYTQLRPRSAEGAALYARSLFLVEDFTEAVPAARRALEMDANNPDLLRIYAYSLVETKDFEAANAAFDQMRKLNALKPEDQMKIGIALQGLGRQDEALKALLAATQLDSTNCDAWFPLGFIYMSKKDYAHAAQMFEKKLQCDPRSLSAYVNAAASYMQIKEFPRARVLLTDMLALKPDFLQGRLWLARYFAQVDSLDMAKAQYDSVLATIGPNVDKYKKEAGEAHSLTGSYYFATQRYERAVDEFRKAQALGYNNAGMELSWGQALLQTLDPKGDQDENAKKKEEAIKHFRRVLEIEQNNAIGHLWLAQSLVLSRVEGNNEMNRKLQEEACSEYRRVLKIDPRNQDAKKGMERIGCK